LRKRGNSGSHRQPVECAWNFTRANPEGVTRLIYENPDGFNTRISGDEKLEKAKELIDELEADVVA
jgi:hypothetical protein